MDNGYMLFDQVRVPHNAMLSRYSLVDPNTCTYSKPANPAVVYGSLTAVRAKIVMRARMVLARAVTVAVRYTAIRRQFSDRDEASTEAPELSVLDYRKSISFVGSRWTFHSIDRCVLTQLIEQQPSRSAYCPSSQQLSHYTTQDPQCNPSTREPAPTSQKATSADSPSSTASLPA
jgi:hypothetical protein